MSDLIDAWYAGRDEWRTLRRARREERAQAEREARCAEFPGHHWTIDESVQSHVTSDGIVLMVHRCNCGAFDWRPVTWEPEVQS